MSEPFSYYFPTGWFLPSNIGAYDDEWHAPEFETRVNDILADIGEMLIGKNRAYGDSALNPVRVFSKASAEEQLLCRVDDKLSRIARGHDFNDEDTVRDLIGYLVLLLLAREDSDG